MSAGRLGDSHQPHRHIVTALRAPFNAGVEFPNSCDFFFLFCFLPMFPSFIPLFIYLFTYLALDWWINDTGTGSVALRSPRRAGQHRRQTVSQAVSVALRCGLCGAEHRPSRPLHHGKSLSLTALAPRCRQTLICLIVHNVQYVSSVSSDFLGCFFFFLVIAMIPSVEIALGTDSRHVEPPTVTIKWGPWVISLVLGQCYRPCVIFFIFVFFMLRML